MADNLTDAQRAVLAMMNRNQQGLDMQQNITGANSDSAFISHFAPAFNAGNGVVNAYRTNENNRRLRNDWADYGEKAKSLLQQLLTPEQAQGGGYTPATYRMQNPQFSLGDGYQQQNPYSIGDTVASVGKTPNQNSFSSIFGQDNTVPFGDSANGEGQRIAESGNFSPETQSDLQYQLSRFAPLDQQSQPVPQQKAYEQALDGRLSAGNFLNKAMEAGMSPVNAMLVYSGFGRPLEQDARQQRIEDNIRTWNNPEATQEEKLQALIGLGVDSHQYDLPWDTQQKRDAHDLAIDKMMIDMGYVPERFERMLGGADYDDGESNSGGNTGFSQTDEKWSNIPYAGGTIGTSGCAPTTMANFLRRFGVNVTPADVAKYSSENGFANGSGGTSWGMFASAGNKFGVPVHQTGKWDDVISALKAGQPVMAGHDPGKFTSDPNSGSGHWLMYNGITPDGKIIVVDANNRKKSGVYSPEEVRSDWERNNPVAFIANDKKAIPMQKAGGNSWGRALRMTPKEQERQAREARAEEREARREAREARKDAREDIRLKLAVQKALNANGKGGTQGLSKDDLKELDKAKIEFTNSGRRLAELEDNKGDLMLDLTGKTKDPYNEEMDKKFIKNLDTIYKFEVGQKYDLDKLSPEEAAILLYKHINEDEDGKYKMGITPETLAEAVAKVVSSRKSSVMPEDLKWKIIGYLNDEEEMKKKSKDLKELGQTPEQYNEQLNEINNMENRIREYDEQQQKTQYKNAINNLTRSKAAKNEWERILKRYVDDDNDYDNFDSD